MDVAAMAPGTAPEPAGGPPGWLDERLAEFQRHLAAGRSMSPHTVRAYVGDARSLLEHACRNGLSELAALDIGAIRSWLAAQHAGGRARATLARRAAAARAFTAFAYSRGWLAADPGSLLKSPRAGRHLPQVLAREQVSAVLAAAANASAAAASAAAAPALAAPAPVAPGTGSAGTGSAGTGSAGTAIVRTAIVRTAIVRSGSVRSGSG